MKKLRILLFVLMVALVAYATYLADHWLGVVAFTHHYLLFCMIASLGLGSAWFALSGKRAFPVGLLIFSLLAVNFFLPPPSTRLLRSAMLKIPPGTDADTIEMTVKQEYQDSAYALPRISKDRAGHFERVHVSLLSQEAGNCTALLFLVENGLVVRGMFVPD